MVFRILFIVCLLAPPARAAQIERPLRVVTVHTVLTEIAREVGGEAVEVVALVRPGTDPHVYEPTPADMRRLQQADLVLACGLGMESYLPRIVGELAANTVILVGDRLPDALKIAGSDHGHDHAGHRHAGEHDHAEIDPHWWHGIEPVMAATALIEREYSLRRPQRAAEFARNALAYRARLVALQTWARAEVAQLPADRRQLVSSHDAFGYLAREHGFSIYPVLGLTTAAEADARQVAMVINLIRKKRVKAVFSERSNNPRIVEAIVRETDAKLAPALYADGLGADESVSTYEAMMRYNLSTIVQALR